MKVLALTRYTRRGASSRVRFHQYFPHLGTAGIEVAVRPFFPDRYLLDLYAGKGRRPVDILWAYWRRMGDMRTLERFDLVWLEKECLPWLPSWLEAMLAAPGTPVVADYDDAVFHNYDLNPNPVVRQVLGEKIDNVMRHADVVVAGNSYLARRAAAAGARRVEIVPTVIDLDRYALPAAVAGDRPFTLGWIGSPATEHYLEAVKPALRMLGREGARLLLVGASAAAVRDLPGAEVRPWREESEVADIAEFDVGIMPLADTPWERGKCGYKLVQCMALAKPVVASPVGANPDIVADGTNGLLASDVAAWEAALRMLRDRPDERARMGLAGRRDVEARYCLQVTAPRLASLLRECAAAQPRRAA